MFSRLKKHLPTELFPRSLLIVILPMVLIQLVMAYVFLESHWNAVTRRLSHNVVATIKMLVDLHLSRTGSTVEYVIRLARDTHDMQLDFSSATSLPPPAQRPYLDLLDDSLSQELMLQIERPFWVDTTSHAAHIEIRILLPNEVLRVLVPRDNVYASGAHIFLLWMTLGSLLLLTVAIIFLRNQIRPIEKLARAAERFGMGQDDPHFKIGGATEIRRAGRSLLEMRKRLQSHIEQRTLILAGVSHDLRTPLTRLKLHLAMLDDSPEVAALKRDTQDMEQMLDDYLSFAKGYQGETASAVDVNTLLADASAQAKRQCPKVHIEFQPKPMHPIALKPQAFKRCLSNLLDNACKHATTIKLASQHSNGHMTITIDDDGPGIARAQREAVFRPFFQLQGDGTGNGKAAHSGTGLGLAIARDVARGHGGDIRLNKSQLGGVQASIILPTSQP